MRLAYGPSRGLSRVSEKDFCKYWVAGEARLSVFLKTLVIIKKECYLPYIGGTDKQMKPLKSLKAFEKGWIFYALRDIYFCTHHIHLES